MRDPSLSGLKAAGWCLWEGQLKLLGSSLCINYNAICYYCFSSSGSCFYFWCGYSGQYTCVLVESCTWPTTLAGLRVLMLLNPLFQGICVLCFLVRLCISAFNILFDVVFSVYHFATTTSWSLCCSFSFFWSTLIELSIFFLADKKEIKKNGEGVRRNSWTGWRLD